MAAVKATKSHRANSLDEVARRFGLSRRQLLETLAAAPGRPARTTRIEEMLAILDRVVGWAGGHYQAMAWYRAEPLAAFGGRTAESLVKDDKASSVRDWLDQVAQGGFA